MIADILKVYSVYSSLLREHCVVSVHTLRSIGFLPVTQALSDLAVVVFIPQIHPQLLSESSGYEDHGLVACVDSMTGAVLNDPYVGPDSGCSEEVPELSLGSPTHHPEGAQQLELKKASQVSPSEQNPEADEKPSGQATRSSQSPKKPFNSIIEHLSVIFPCYARYSCDS